MIKTLTNSFLSLLMVATLLWGGCISCPQFFMFANKTGKSCCQTNGRCERNAKDTPENRSTLTRECRRMPLEPQKDFSGLGAVALAVAPLDEIVSQEAESPVIVARSHTPVLGDSPPDLSVLNSSLLI